ncbi:hypothetical protein [Yoonia sp. 2307UL14-13]|uniref:hypothetical protein n=1 Tax=Yoonia sp. 2307UL14-13 TaxID=3126506 RepID=UPI00309C1059
MIETALIILAVLIPSATLAYWCARRHIGIAITIMAAIWVGFTLMMYSGMQHSIDWDWYLGALMFVSAPSAAGLFIAGTIGWIKGRKDIYA